jgi:hypothetical protein
MEKHLDKMMDLSLENQKENQRGYKTAWLRDLRTE